MRCQMCAPQVMEPGPCSVSNAYPEPDPLPSLGSGFYTIQYKINSKRYGLFPNLYAGLAGKM